MKRNFTLLTILGALIAVAVPASAMAVSPVTVVPASHAFQISGSAMPTISSSLTGSCEITNISSKVPAAPNNQNATKVSMALTAAPTVSCGAGVSASFSAATTLVAYKRGRLDLLPPASGFSMSYTSLPGCTLSGGGTGILGIVSTNPTPEYGPTSWHADGSILATWAGGSCALAGKTETVSFHTNGATTPNAAVTDTTNGANNILLSGGGI